ncbi:diguanylate cyclase (GGDEF)-like protein [Geodermatophilus bullaregiensis]|uniref:GGDEF domain-containing protein n=1 Tax=Geodermatophilus bullaregiensis TaxID=1564160 RepID=UPI00195B4610|nr:GGDEF domain-containing protein [Geodermatophilus bullaregiensis]MBM7807358.1 diguanylate cyclase (GGDEF)-like protein [Geodermatophilus bullaregiensis]
MSQASSSAPQDLDLLPLADRLRWLLAVRTGLVVALPLAAWPLTRTAETLPVEYLVLPGVALLAFGLLLQKLSGRGRRWAVLAITVPVILDAVHLGWALYVTGGIGSPVVYVIVLHVLAVSLLSSFRSGLKLALWHSLVVMCVLEGVTTGSLPARAGVEGFDAVTYSVFLTVVWVTAVTTAVLGAVNERELRRRRYDEEALRRLAAALHEAESTTAVAEALLDFTVDAADAAIAAVHCHVPAGAAGPPVDLALRRRGDGEVEVLREVGAPAEGSLLDDVGRHGSTFLAAVTAPDAWVDEVLDGARRVVAIPFGLDGQGSGVLTFTDDARTGSRIQQRRVGVAEQAVAHAATAFARVALLEHLQRSAFTDGLTGVFNRRAFDAALDRELSLAARTDAPLAVLIFDLDHFKKLNDTFGHQAGDDVLRGVGAALRSSARLGDVVARYGGEEFAVVMPGAEADDAIAFARRIRKVLADVEAPRPITASVGIACQRGAGLPAADLLGAADTALYASKAGGRDQARMAGVEGPVSGAEVEDLVVQVQYPWQETATAR